jgi:hypothetical protein
VGAFTRRFLSLRRPPRWDLPAERYAAAVTLNEMLTGAPPIWGDGAEHALDLLRLGPARSDHHRDLGDTELPRGEHASMARNQPAVLAHQRRARPAPTP